LLHCNRKTTNLTKHLAGHRLGATLVTGCRSDLANSCGRRQGRLAWDASASRQSEFEMKMAKCGVVMRKGHKCVNVCKLLISQCQSCICNMQRDGVSFPSEMAMMQACLNQVF